MKITEGMIKDYREIGEKGDQVELMKLTGIESTSHMSQIMSGKADTTVSNVETIKGFLSDRKEKISRITESDSN